MKPRRIEENVDGVVYVNDRCINCSTCSNFAPEIFMRAEKELAHVVSKQPQTAKEILNTRAAIVACPVAAIRVEEGRNSEDKKKKEQSIKNFFESFTSTKPQDVDKKKLAERITSRNERPPFPRPFLEDVEDVYWTGHHNEASFGATPYLLKAKFDSQHVWIMIDTPKYSKLSVDAVKAITSEDGPDYLFLSHVDDTAHHNRWKEKFPKMKRIINVREVRDNNWVGDETLEEVEIFLDDTKSSIHRLDGTPVVASNNDNIHHTFDDEILLLHTPGHSPGSTTLYRKPSRDTENVTKKPGILFTGDTYGYYSSNKGGGHMTAFPRYGDDLNIQMNTLLKFLELEWDIIAPGHGHPRDYRSIDKNKNEKRGRQTNEMKVAIDEMRKYI